MESVRVNRLKLILQYDGSAFFGWQMQREERTVQGELEAALTRLTGARRPVEGSGRTDRGVHATGQVAAVTVPETWGPPKLEKALNAVLPNDIWIESIESTTPDFSPRYDAVARTYLYRLGVSEQSRSPFQRPWCWALATDVDSTLLTEAAYLLPGEHSFKAFAKSGQPERGELCTVHEARWEPWDDLGFSFQVTANRYLHHMVRYLVGTMVDIARERRPLDDLGRLLANPDDDLETSPPAPPEGLFLHHVAYPTEAGSEAPDATTTTP